MIPVLTYHRITDEPGPECVRPALFRRHLEYLRRSGHTPIPAARFVDCAFGGARAPHRPVLLTFDDGYEDNLHVAAGILGEFGFPAIVFVIADWVGRTNEWDTAPGRSSARMMGAGQLRQWAARGLEVGSHTSSHRPLDTLDEGEQWAELSGSRTRLEALLGVAVTAVAYPWGAFSEVTESLARRAGYEAGFATYRGTRPWRADRYRVHRVAVRDSWGERKLAYKTGPLYLAASTVNLVSKELRRFRTGSRGPG